MSRPAPKSLRPLTQAQMWWRTGIIVVVVLLCAFGWSLTVAQTLKSSVQQTQQNVSARFQKTTETAVETSAIRQAWQDVAQKASKTGRAVRAWMIEHKQANVYK